MADNMKQVVLASIAAFTVLFVALIIALVLTNEPELCHRGEHVVTKTTTSYRLLIEGGPLTTEVKSCAVDGK